MWMWMLCVFIVYGIEQDELTTNTHNEYKIATVFICSTLCLSSALRHSYTFICIDRTFKGFTRKGA